MYTIHFGKENKPEIPDKHMCLYGAMLEKRCTSNSTEVVESENYNAVLVESRKNYQKTKQKLDNDKRKEKNVVEFRSVPAGENLYYRTIRHVAVFDMESNKSPGQNYSSQDAELSKLNWTKQTFTENGISRESRFL